MNPRKDPHRHITRIVTDEHLVDLEDRPKTLGERRSRNMREIEINLILAADAVALETYLKDLACSDVAWYQIAVGWVFFFEEIPTLGIGNIAWNTSVLRIAWNPNSSAFAAGRFAHQPQFVFAGDGRRMDLDKLAVGVPGTLLITCRRRRAGACHRVGGFSKYQARTAGGHDDSIRCK